MISCRAKVAEDCRGEWEPVEEELTDSTLAFTNTVVCEACYILIEPFMKMNEPNIPLAADIATEHYRVNLRFAQQHENPAVLVNEANRVIQQSREGSPRWTSAHACRRMAIAEVERRFNGD